MLRGLLVSILLGLPGIGAAQDCRDDQFDGADFTICEVDMTRDDLRLFLRDDQGQVYGWFPRIEQNLPEGQRLGFAINAGMFHEDRSPVGLYVEEGVVERGIITSAGPGNFGMLPNGVFCVMNGRAEVIESLRFATAPPRCRFATQSGPMLVIDDRLHPRFRLNSTSLNIRNGVGTDPSGERAVFAISNEPVNFHHFARLFRDHLGLPNALYLDGRVSRLHAPDLGRSDFGFPVGPILGTVVDQR